MVKVYFPEEGQIQVHLSRVCSCPPHLPAGLYWCGGNRKCPGRVLQWVQKLFCNEQEDKQNSNQEASESEECAHELEDEKSSTSEHKSDPVPIVKQRVPPPSVKSRYSLRDQIVAPERLV